MIQKRSFTKYTIIFQVFLLLFAIATIPASAASEADQSFPLILGGEVTIDGEPAPVGTEITAKLGETTVGTTTVDSEGLYGDSPTNRFLITSEPDDYENLKFYVNGVETDINSTPLKNAVPGDIFTTTFTAASAEEEQPAEKPAETSSSGGFSGGSGGYSSSDSSSGNDSGIQDSLDEGNAFESTAFAGDEAEIETIGDVPSSESHSNGLIGGLFGLILVSLVGAIIVKRRNK